MLYFLGAVSIVALSWFAFGLVAAGCMLRDYISGIHTRGNAYLGRE